MTKPIDIFNEWINSEEVKAKNLSPISIKNYERTAKNLNFGILNGQPTIIKKLKENYENPNTQSSYLNMIILLRKFKDLDVDKLIKLRNTLKLEIDKHRKNNLEEANGKLPSYEYLENQLQYLVGIKYIINYLFINFSFRNKDINLRYLDDIPTDKEDENYIIVKPKFIMLIINDYKTQKSYGKKIFRITDKKFRKEIIDRKLKDGDYLIGRPKGGKYSISNFNDVVLKYTIDQLGEAKLFKIIMKHLIDKKDYNKIEELSKSRGTSLDTLIKSYNVYNTK